MQRSLRRALAYRLSRPVEGSKLTLDAWCDESPNSVEVILLPALPRRTDCADANTGRRRAVPSHHSARTARRERRSRAIARGSVPCFEDEKDGSSRSITRMDCVLATRVIKIRNATTRALGRSLELGLQPFFELGEEGHWAVIFRDLQYEVDKEGFIVDGHVIRAH